MDSQKLSELLNESFDVLASDITKLQRLVSFYSRIYGVTPSCLSCGGNKKYLEMYNKLKNEGLTIMSTQEQSEFLLKDGVSGIPLDFGSRVFLSPTTLTDELAVQFLSKNKRRITIFKKYPENWEQLVEEYLNPKIQDEVIETPDTLEVSESGDITLKKGKKTRKRTK